VARLIQDGLGDRLNNLSDRLDRVNYQRSADLQGISEGFVPQGRLDGANKTQAMLCYATLRRRVVTAG
jgi:hypothetical protein